MQDFPFLFTFISAAEIINKDEHLKKEIGKGQKLEYLNKSEIFNCIFSGFLNNYFKTLKYEYVITKLWSIFFNIINTPYLSYLNMGKTVN